MPNPYAARTTAGIPIEVPVVRLRCLGATDRVLAEARRRWRELTAAERVETADMLAVATDDELVEAIADMTADLNPDGYPDALTGVPDGAGQPSGPPTGTDDEEDQDDPPPPPGATIAQILVWVADTPHRAESALAAEEMSGRPRKGLLRELRKIAYRGRPEG